MEDLVGTVMLGIIINRTVNSLPPASEASRCSTRSSVSRESDGRNSRSHAAQRDSILSAVIIVVIKGLLRHLKTLFNSVCKVDLPEPEPPAIPIIRLSIFFSYLSRSNSSGINLGQMFSEVQITVERKTGTNGTCLSHCFP